MDSNPHPKEILFYLDSLIGPRARRLSFGFAYYLQWTKDFLGRSGGLVVSVLASISDDPSSNPAEVTVFSVNC